MDALVTVLTVILAIVSIVLIALVMLQEGDQKGLSGSLTGGGGDFNSSYAAKNSGRTKEGQLKKYTRLALSAFMVLALAIAVLQKYV